MKLTSGERKPFHWEDRDQENLVVKFKLDQGPHVSWSSPFSINDRGSLVVQNKIENETRSLFKVTKKGYMNSTMVFI